METSVPLAPPAAALQEAQCSSFRCCSEPSVLCSIVTSVLTWWHLIINPLLQKSVLTLSLDITHYRHGSTPSPRLQMPKVEGNWVRAEGCRRGAVLDCPCCCNEMPEVEIHKEQKIIFHGPGDRDSTIKVPAGLVSWWGLISASGMIWCFRVLPWRKAEGRREKSCVLTEQKR